ncbi:hypothetical protein F3C99_11330 [Vitellibacter sp. q18]|nr:hypothetical protein [Aequorivita lutea]
METYLQIMESFEKEVAPIQQNDPFKMEHVEKGIQHCQNCIEQLREQVINRGFKSRQDEIRFFKTLKPKLVGTLIAFLNIRKILTHLPIIPTDKIATFYAEQTALLYAFFQEKHELYYYFLRNHDHLDNVYFTRGYHMFSNEINAFPHIIDSHFSTPKDMFFAQFIGNQKTLAFLKECPIRRQETAQPPAHTFKWTGQKVDLVELVYALQASGLINNGNVGIKELALTFQDLFAIEIGDYYRTFLEIRMRKTKPAKLLDTLKTSLQNKIASTDA